MALVDFSNAKITAVMDSRATPSAPTQFACATQYLGLNSNRFMDGTDTGGVATVDETALTSSCTATPYIDGMSGCVINFNGTFKTGISASDHFYIGPLYSGRYYAAWKISGISFNPGDTFSFSIRIDLPQESE